VIRRLDPLLALAVFLTFCLRANSRVTEVQPTIPRCAACVKVLTIDVIYHERVLGGYFIAVLLLFCCAVGELFSLVLLYLAPYISN